MGNIVKISTFFLIFFFAFYLFKEFYREFELEISEEPPDEEKARHVIEKKYVRKVEHENGTKVFVPFKMGDSIEEFQNLGEGIYVYFCFIKYFGLIFLFIGLLLLLPTILMILQDNNLNESKSNIFFRTMTANIAYFSKNADGSYSEEEKEKISSVFTLLLWFYFVINILIFLSIFVFRIIVKRKRISLSKKAFFTAFFIIMVKKNSENYSCF